MPENNRPVSRPKHGPHGPHGPGGPPMEKAKDFKGTLRKLLTYVKPFKAAIIAVMIFAVGSTIFNIAGPKVLSGATTEIFNGLVSKVSGGSGVNFDKIAQILLTVMGMYVLSGSFMFVQGWLMSGVSQKMTYRMRKDISEKIHRIPMKYYESNTHGEVLSRVTNDVDTLGMSLNQSITQLITSVTTLIGVLVMMLSISGILTVMALLILPISTVLVMLVVKKSQKYFKQQQEYLGHVNGQVEEVYGGHLVIKAFNREERSLEEFERDNRILYKSAMLSQFLSGMMQPVMQFVGNLGYVGVAVIGAWLAARGSISVGDIQAFIQYVRQFTQPITQIAQVSNMLQSMAAAAERVFEFLEEDEEENNAENPVAPEKIEGNVEFEHVKFGYDPNKIIISDFSADTAKGHCSYRRSYGSGKDNNGKTADEVL